MGENTTINWDDHFSDQRHDHGDSRPGAPR